MPTIITRAAGSLKSMGFAGKTSTVPGAPTIGTAAATSTTTATVAFTAPSANGGTAVTGYTATSSPGGITGTGSSSPITVAGLTVGTTYTFTVTATNAQGTGSASGSSNSIVPQIVFNGFNTPATMNGSTTYTYMRSVTVNSSGL